MEKKKSEKKKKRGKWVKPRHRIITAIVRPFFHLVAVFKYHAKVDRFKEQGKRNWLVLSNHQTGFDQFFVGLAFRRQMYYVALEDIFSNGFVSKLLTWATAPIPFMKATSDLRAVINCIRIAGEGGSIAIFPEGNRTYSGKTCYIKPSIAAMAQKLGLPIAIFKIEGGYGIKPRWADKTRKGRMRAGVRRVIEPEEYSKMSKEELYELICRELDVDETKDPSEFYSDKAAENVERVLWVCPDCGISEFESSGDTFSCKKCGRKYRYLPNKQIEALEGETPYKYVADWYDYQEDFVRNLDLTLYADTPVCTESADVAEVIVYDRKRPLIKDARVSIFGDRLEIRSESGNEVLMYDDVKAMGCIVSHKLNIFHKDRIYQLSGDKSFNALKYCNIYYHAKFVKEGHTDGEFQFLGL